MNAYEKAYPEKNKNACQNSAAEIWKNMKKDYPTSDELRKEEDRKANELSELSWIYLQGSVELTLHALVK